MKRRRFISYSFRLLGGIACGISVQSCGMASVPTVMSLLIDLAVNTGAGILSEQLNQWLNGASPEQVVAKDASIQMINAGFNTFQDQRIFVAENILFFGASDNVGFNACAPFLSAFNGNIQGGMLEGPAIVGLSFFSKHLIDKNPNAPKSEIAKTLLPFGSVDRSQWDFTFENGGAASFLTQKGKVDIDYQAWPADRKGIINLEATGFVNGTANVQYPIQW